jgi:hypothetical protein
MPKYRATTGPAASSITLVPEADLAAASPCHLHKLDLETLSLVDAQRQRPRPLVGTNHYLAGLQRTAAVHADDVALERESAPYRLT